MEDGNEPPAIKRCIHVSCNFTSESHSEIARLSRKEHEVGSRLPQSQQGSTREKLCPQWLSDDLAAYLEQKYSHQTLVLRLYRTYGGSKITQLHELVFVDCRRYCHLNPLFMKEIRCL